MQMSETANTENIITTTQTQTTPKPYEAPKEVNLVTSTNNVSETVPSGWKKLYTPDGRQYYQNDINHQTQWEKPTFTANNTLNNNNNQPTVLLVEKKQSVGVGQDVKKVSCLCGATICGIINIILGIAAWVLAIIASAVLIEPYAGIVALMSILIFLISNIISSIVSGICGDECCSGSLLATAWGIFGLCTIAAMVDVYLSFNCWDCTPERIAGGFIGTLYFVATILFVVDQCQKANRTNVKNQELRYRLLDEN